MELDDPDDLDLVADLQLRISAPSDPPRAHLGECETLTLAYREGAAVFSNDFDAARQGERLGVPVLATLDVLDLLVAASELTREVAEEAESAMRAGGRVPTDRRR